MESNLLLLGASASYDCAFNELYEGDRRNQSEVHSQSTSKAKFTILQVISGVQGGVEFSLRPDEGDEPEDA